MVSNLVIFDTSIFIDHLRTNRHRQRIESVSGLIRTSSVVLAELWRGATSNGSDFELIHAYREYALDIW